MGEPALRVIAHTRLVTVIKSDITAGRARCEAAYLPAQQALLHKYDKPPDLEDTAAQNVVRQALSAEWAA